jgi:hypothetical protein
VGDHGGIPGVVLFGSLLAWTMSFAFLIFG